ncbi:MAG: fumarylacetoacetate hydrolase family protein [Actinomycetota bacterium]|nr:fumarylacetoacetate hydrolase family protein [Actinomycetota bacterium]
MAGNDDFADRIWHAIESRTAIPPLTIDAPELTVDAAYDIQDLVIAKHEAAGARITAIKLGLTSVAKQLQMSVNEPLYGWFTDEMELRGDNVLEVGRFIQPRAEPEIAFRTGRALGGPGVTGAEVLAATEAVAPAIDILDSRFTGYKFTLADVTADNSSAAAYALGDWVKPRGDLRLTGCVFKKNGDLVATASGAAVMEHPAAAVAWFVRKLHQRGRDVPAGSVVLAGAWTAAIPLTAGDMLRASFDRIGTVDVRCI